MSSFTDPVKVEWSQDNPSMAKTIEGWRWYLDYENPGEYIDIPARLNTDGKSIPTRNIFALINPISAILIVLILLLFRRWDGRTAKGDVSHDWLYFSREIRTAGGHVRLCSKSEADKIHLQMCKTGGLKWINRSKSLRGWRKWNWNVRCYIVYLALFFGGHFAWYKHRFREWRERK